MKYFALILLLVATLFARAQNHAEGIRTINSLESATAYASKYREVSVSMVDEVRDRFLFEEIDTTDLPSNIGLTFENFGRVTKLIKDTIVYLVELEMIQFDLNKTSEESARILQDQIKKRLANGETYWTVKEKFNHTSAYFYSGPRILERIRVLSPDKLMDQDSEWVEYEYENLRGLLRVVGKRPETKAFYVIGYNSN